MYHKQAQLHCFSYSCVWGDSQYCSTVGPKQFEMRSTVHGASLKACKQVQQLKQDVNRILEKINQSMFLGKLNLWCVQSGLLPQLTPTHTS